MNQTSQDKWLECLAFIKDNLDSPEQFSVWFEPLSLDDYRDGRLTLFAPSEFFIEQLEYRFLRLITVAIRKSFGQETQLFYKFHQVSDDPSTAVTFSNPNISAAVKPGPASASNPFYHAPVEEIDPQLNPRYTFENYCVGESNKLAYTLGEAIADNPAIKTFNPLFIFGPTGVGKTHLIQAIGIRIKEHNPNAKVLYITARLFESQFTEHSRGNINSFINFYQSIDTLIIDDIQELANGHKEKTQNAFFYIFSHLYQNGRQLIMSSDCRPSDMVGFEERLLSRFKCGATAEICKPERDLRRRVLEQRAHQDGLVIPDNVLDFIADNVTESVRELDGVMASLLANSMVLNCELDIDLAQRVVGNSVKMRRANRKLNFEQVTQQVSAYYDIDPDVIFTKTRKREISDARQLLMYLAKKHTKMPMTAIGTRLSRTHATVLYACRAIEDRLLHEKKLRDDVAKIESELLK